MISFNFSKDVTYKYEDKYTVVIKNNLPINEFLRTVLFMETRCYVEHAYFETWEQG